MGVCRIRRSRVDIRTKVIFPLRGRRICLESFVKLPTSAVLSPLRPLYLHHILTNSIKTGCLGDGELTQFNLQPRLPLQTSLSTRITQAMTFTYLVALALVLAALVQAAPFCDTGKRGRAAGRHPKQRQHLLFQLLEV
jgi:hypothetical protein